MNVNIIPSHKSPKSLTQSIKSSKSIRGSNSEVKKKESRSKSSKVSRPELDLSEDNDKLVIVMTIKQEILEKALELIYEKYLEKQTVYFVSHCSHLAWKSLIEWNYQKKDKGGYKEMATREYLDVEPKTSPKDSWAGNSIPIGQKHISDPHLNTDKKSLLTGASSELVTAEDYSKAADELTHTSEAIVKQPSFKLQFVNSKMFQKQRKKSEDPLLSSFIPGKGVDLRKESYELPPPVPMQGKTFPSSRVEVKYNITPGSRGQVAKKEPKVKTIRLKKTNVPQEENEKNIDL